MEIRISLRCVVTYCKDNMIACLLVTTMQGLQSISYYYMLASAPLQKKKALISYSLHSPLLGRALKEKRKKISDMLTAFNIYIVCLLAVDENCILQVCRNWAMSIIGIFVLNAL